MGRAIDRIAGLGGAEDREAVAAFKEATGHDYEEFREYWGSESREEAALRAAWPRRPRVPDVTRDELVEIVHRIMTGLPPDQDWYLLVLESSTSHPAVSDLIFWPPPELESASAEEIVNTILSHPRSRCDPESITPPHGPSSIPETHAPWHRSPKDRTAGAD